jgi:hypothetical protein
MDPLGGLLTTCPIQMGREYTMEPYPSGQFRFIDDQDSQFANRSVLTLTWTRSDGPERLLTLGTQGISLCFAYKGSQTFFYE